MHKKHKSVKTGVYDTVRHCTGCNELQRYRNNRGDSKNILGEWLQSVAILCGLWQFWSFQKNGRVATISAWGSLRWTTTFCRTKKSCNDVNHKIFLANNDNVFIVKLCSVSIKIKPTNCFDPRQQVLNQCLYQYRSAIRIFCQGSAGY